MPMTPGERAVWAAAYVATRQRLTRNPPTGLYRPGNEDRARAWHRGNTAHAAEVACDHVRAMRAAVEHVEDGYGADGDVAGMLRDMLQGDT